MRPNVSQFTLISWFGNCSLWWHRCFSRPLLCCPIRPRWWSRSHRCAAAPAPARSVRGCRSPIWAAGLRSTPECIALIADRSVCRCGCSRLIIKIDQIVIWARILFIFTYLFRSRCKRNCRETEQQHVKLHPFLCSLHTNKQTRTLNEKLCFYSYFAFIYTFSDAKRTGLSWSEKYKNLFDLIWFFLL